MLRAVKVPDIEVHEWSGLAIERMARALDDAATIAEPALRQAAIETAFALRCCGRAVDFVDENDVDVLSDLVERLDALRVDARRILEAIGERAETSSEEEKTVVRRYTPPAPPSEDPTVVRAPLHARIRAPQLRRLGG